jgi:signal transduction histidine kinase
VQQLDLVAAYYVVSETTTNVAKHANASVANVELDTRDTILLIEIPLESQTSAVST